MTGADRLAGGLGSVTRRCHRPDADLGLGSAPGSGTGSTGSTLDHRLRPDHDDHHDPVGLARRAAADTVDGLLGGAVTPSLSPVGASPARAWVLLVWTPQQQATEAQPWIAPGEPIISLRGVTKSFGSHTVLEDITFDVPKGRITAILGPSGTGKSVLLKNILGPAPARARRDLGRRRPDRRACGRSASTRSARSSACSSRTAPCSAP